MMARWYDGLLDELTTALGEYGQRAALPLRGSDLTGFSSAGARRGMKREGRHMRYGCIRYSFLLFLLSP